jgi:hypothetical protein
MKKEKTVKRIHYRNDIKKIALEDGLWPRERPWNLKEENLRYQAIQEVLYSIPDDDYQKLKDKASEFEWFIPDKNNLAGNYPFFLGKEAVKSEDGRVELAAHTQVLYLSPILEGRVRDVVVAVVAHELAHIILGHELIASKKDYDEQEHEVFECVCKWGFSKEAKKHRASQKRKGILVG